VRLTAHAGFGGRLHGKGPLTRDLAVQPILLHVSSYLGKAASALHPGDPVLAGQWADGQKLRVLHGRAKAVAATLASVAAKARANPRTRHLDLADMDKAVTYLENNREHMRYDKALASGWPIATGLIEGSCRYVRGQVRDYRREVVTRRRRGHPQDPRCCRERRPRRLHELLQGTLPAGTSPGPLRSRKHPRPRPRRMTETPRNDTPLKKMHPPRSLCRCSSQASSAANSGYFPCPCNWYHWRISPGSARLTMTGSAANVRAKRTIFCGRVPFQVMTAAI